MWLRLDTELQTERAYLHRYFIDHNRGRTPKETQTYLETATCDPILSNFSLLLDQTSALLAEEESMRGYRKALGAAMEARGSIVVTAEFCVLTHTFLMAYLGQLQQHAHLVTEVLLTATKAKIAIVSATEAKMLRVARNTIALAITCVGAAGVAHYSANHKLPVFGVTLLVILVASVAFLADDPLARADYRVLQALDTLWSSFIAHVDPAYRATTHLHSASSLLALATSTSQL